MAGKQDMQQENTPVSEDTAQEELSKAFEEALSLLPEAPDSTASRQVDENGNAVSGDDPTSQPQQEPAQPPSQMQQPPPTGEQQPTQQSAQQPSSEDEEKAQMRREMEELQRQVQALQAQPSSEEQQQQQQQEGEPGEEEEWVDPLQRLDEGQQQLLQQFNEDYPDVSGAINIHFRAFAERLLHYFEAREQALIGQFQQSINPLIETHQQFARNERDSALQSQGIDLNALNGWVNQQPATIKQSFSDILENGTAEQVAELMQVYQQATGAQAASSGNNAPAQQSVDPRLESMMAVQSRRQDLPIEADPNDFAGAFKEAAAKL